MKKKKLDEYFPNLFLVGLVAIVAIVALVLYGGGTPAGALGVNEVQVSTWQEYCTETDRGNDIFTPGMAHYGYVQYVDWCSDGSVGQYKCRKEVNSKIVDSLTTVECPCGCTEGTGACKYCPNGCDHNNVCLE